MTVSDKTLSVANNVLDVYKSGELAILDESQYMHPTVSGSVISVNDVNGVEHELNVKLTSDTITNFSGVTVSRYGKNLWNERWINGMYSTSTGNIAVSSAVNKSCVASDPNYPITVLPNTDYYIVQPYNLSVYAFFYDKDDNWISYKGVSFTTHLVTTPEDCKYIRFYVNTNYGNVYLNDICVSLSGGEYEPYKEPQTALATADGTVEGLTSLSPNMTLLTNTNGVVIDCQYYRDIDLYIDNQITDIALTGGV